MAQHPALSQLEAYWNGLRRGRPVPLRSEVDPRGIDRALEFAFVLERIAPGVARFRLAGMHLNSLMGMEVRGMPLTSFFTPDGRSQVNDVLEHVFEQPAKARLKLQGEAGIGRPPLSAELMLLPLKSDLGDISRALGCLVSTGETGRAPRRFSVKQVAVEQLDVVSRPPQVRPVGSAPAPMTTAAPQSPSPAPQAAGFGEATRPFMAGQPVEDEAAPKRSERPYLRLVKSDD